MRTVVLVDGQAIVRQGLRSLLEAEGDLEVVGETGDGVEAVELVRTIKPDILVIDLILNSLSGFEVIRQVTKFKTKVVVYSSYDFEGYVMDVIRAGASAYVLKSSDVAELLTGIRQALAGHRYLSSPLADLMIEAYTINGKADRKDPYYLLTAREREVLQLAAQGLTNAQIGQKLFISRRTVEIHRFNIIRKLGLRVPHVKLVQYAVERGIVKMPPLVTAGASPTPTLTK